MSEQNIFTKVANWVNKEFPNSVMVEPSQEFLSRIENRIELGESDNGKLHKMLTYDYDNIFDLLDDKADAFEDILKYVKICHQLGQEVSLDCYLEKPTDDSMIREPNYKHIVSKNGMLTNDEIVHILKSKIVMILDHIDVSQYSIWVNV